MVDHLRSKNKHTIKNLLKALRLAGIHLWVEQGKLRSKAPKGAITPAWRTQIRSHKDALISFLQQAEQSDVPLPIVPARRPSKIPLSFAQQRLWFLDQLEPDSAFYNMPTIIRLQGQLDVLALEQSFTYLIERHESLRTTFDAVDGEPMQVIHDTTSFTLPVIAVNDAQQAQAHVNKEVSTPFNLSKGPLLRVQLIKIAETEHLLVLNIHHIISDGWSMGVLVEEVIHTYRAYTEGNDPTLPALPIQYADFAIWQHETLSGKTLKDQLSFWREQLMGAPAQLELPIDRPRPPVQSYRGAHYAFELDAGLASKLNQLAQSHDATLFMVLHAAFNVLLSRYTRQTDMVVGTLIANRNRAEIERMIGFFVNTLVLRTQLEDNPSFTMLLSRVRQTVLAAYDHQDLPFEQLVDELQVERTLSYSPLFQVMFALQNTKIGSSALPSLTATQDIFEFPFAKFDLSLDVMENDDSLEGLFEYSTDLFNEATIIRMASHFRILLNSMVSQPEQPVLQLPMLTDAEFHQIVHEWNDTAVDFGEAESIHALFEQQVERTPDAVALVSEQGGAQLTYAELNLRANQLAHYLRALGVGPEKLVGICIERGMSMIVGLLGILKAGAAYVPLDPAYPQERLEFILEDADISIILTEEKLVAQLSSTTAQLIKLDSLSLYRATQDQDTANPEPRTTRNNLAYVIYTSGSTGKPKGVLIEHHSLINFTQAATTAYHITATDRMLQFASISFDTAAEEIYPCLTCGGTLVLRSVQMLSSVSAFIEASQKLQLTIWDLPTAYWHLLTTELTASNMMLPDSLRLVIIGGERALPKRLIQWQQIIDSNAGSKPVLMNGYGPTEATVVATVCTLGVSETVHSITTDPVTSSSDPRLQSWLNTSRSEVPIGRPLANVQVYILDTRHQLVPIGVSGELHVGGAGLARGYLNRPELTAERFIEHPQFGRLYKTGDLCRWLPDGDIEYLGRTDFQVKIRGFRVELGEIENMLLAQDNIREAVVLAREDNPGEKRLVAYLVADSAARQPVVALDVDRLRQQLSQRLPEYMVPSAFVELDVMPMTTSRKLDRSALPAPDYADLNAQTTFVTPRNEVEASLVQAFSDVLRIPELSIHDNFFRMGGDSILSIQLVNRAAQHGYTLSVKDVFKHPTIAQLATVIRSEQTQVRASQEVQTGRAPLLPIQRWFLEWDQAEMHHFNQSALLTVKPPIDQRMLEEAIRVLLRHHDALRCKFRRDESGWYQQYLPPRDGVPLEIVDLQAVPQWQAKISAICKQTQATLNPLTGDLVRWVYFKTDGASADRLLIVIHHLAVDGVSWRILLEDLTTLLDGGQLPPKTSSYRDWVETLQSATQNGHFDAEISHWLTKPIDISLPLDQPDALNTMANSYHHQLTLSQEQTEQLLRTLPDLHDVTLDSIFLTALTETLTDWSGHAALRVKFESYGRQELFDTINLNRTVGWFTSVYPLSMTRFSGSAVKRIRYTLDQLRQVTDGGISFDALRYFHPDEAIREQFEASSSADVLYNYLGQLDNLHDNRFGPAKESAGLQVSPHFIRDTLIECNTLVQGGQLHIDWTVSPQIRREIAESLLHTFAQQLDSLIAEALEDGERVAIPSDFVDTDLSKEELESLLKESTSMQTDLFVPSENDEEF